MWTGSRKTWVGDIEEYNGEDKIIAFQTKYYFLFYKVSLGIKATKKCVLDGLCICLIHF